MTETATAPGLAAGTWHIDPAHSEVTFSIRHMMTTVRGNFTDFRGRIEVGDDVFRSTVRAEVAVASIDTRNAERDHLVRSSEIFDVSDHPLMVFVAAGVTQARTGRRARHQRYAVEGELTIRGVTRPVTLQTEFHGAGTDQWGSIRAGFTATAQILRSDFGIEFNVPLQGDRLLLGDDIEIGLAIQAVLARS